MSSRRHFIASAVAASVLGQISGRSHSAQSSVMTITTGFSVGGNSDVICRSVAEGLRVIGFPASTVVENRTGAAGQISVTAMKSKPQDGSALLMTSSSVLTIYPHIYKQLAYDPVRDLVPVTLACKADLGIAIGPSVPAQVRTLDDFLAWAKANGGANYGSAGSGTSPHLLTAVIAKDAGVPMVHVPYRGSAPALQDLLAGQIHAVAAPVGEFMPHMGGRRIRLLAVSGESRNNFMPEVPTLTELGHGKFRTSEWYGFFLPAGTPQQQVNELHGSLGRALQTSLVDKAFAAIGVRPTASSPEVLSRMIRDDLQYWSRVVKSVGFTAES